jgi:hypothetical protein
MRSIGYLGRMARHPAVLVKELQATLDELATTDLDAVCDATVLADVLVDLLGCESRLQAVAARVAGRVDASRVWGNDGSRSCAAWLGRAAGRDRAEAAGIVSRGRELRDMPVSDAEHAAGRLSARHVRLLARARAMAPEEFASDESWLVARARELRFDDFARVIAYWCQCAAADEIEARARRRYERRAAKLSRGLEGTGHLQVEFEAIGFALFGEALRRIEQELWEADWAEARGRLGPGAKKRDLTRSDAQRRYDALVEMATRASAAAPGAAPSPPLVTVHVDHPTTTGRICELANGTVVTPGEILPLLSCADIERAVFDGPGRIVNLGRRRRLFVDGTRRAVEILHRRCDHPTCDVPAEWCDIDHVVDWEHGGRTDHANGRPRCPSHHPGRRRKNPPPRRNGKAAKKQRRGSERGDDEDDPTHDV